MKSSPTKDRDTRDLERSERDRASATRARVMQSLHEGNRRRTGRLLVWLPLAAIFIGGSAWATSGGGREIVDALFGQAGSSTQTAGSSGPAISEGKTTAAAHQPPAPAPAEEPALDPAPTDRRLGADLTESPSVEDPDRNADPSAPQTKASPNAPSSPTPPSSSSAASHAPDDGDALALYQTAHQLHFSGGDPGAARTAWERYLRAAPGGRFATEASYNRALCLIRLGETAAAKRALSPFADGAYGGYRQSESQALLDAL